VKKRVEVVGNAEVFILRGNLIPLVRLADVLGIAHRYQNLSTGDLLPDRRVRIADRRSDRYDLEEASAQRAANQAAPAERRADQDRRIRADSDLNIVVISSGALEYGLIVDDLHDTVEIVVKPLGRHLKGLREYAGATILGDGQVALILDTTGIATKQKLVSMAGSRRAKELEEETHREEFQDRHTFLTFRNAPDEFCAAPMELVARVSQVRNDQIQTVGGRRTMQYRGGSLPLVTLKDAAQVSELHPEQDKAVVVFNIFGREVGLLAGMPVDVVETTAAVDQETLRQKGVLGSAVIGKNTTLIIDIHDLVEAVFPDWSVRRNHPAEKTGPTSDVVLLAEDSEFFRNQIKRFLESDGYTVLAAEDGQVAWELLQKNAAKVKVVVTDIEMPRMDGLTLARTLRADRRFTHLPVFGLSSLAGEDDAARARSAGVDEYHIKLDRDKLLEGLRRILQKEEEEEPATASAGP
jgi:two-component system, chemotaxis family, sensor kinase CheA